MSQQSVETVIGKLITDEAFREQFFADPSRACFRTGLCLHPVELNSLIKLDRAKLVELALTVDGKICKARLP